MAVDLFEQVSVRLYLREHVGTLLDLLGEGVRIDEALKIVGVLLGVDGDL